MDPNFCSGSVVEYAWQTESEQAPEVWVSVESIKVRIQKSILAGNAVLCGQQEILKAVWDNDKVQRLRKCYRFRRLTRQDRQLLLCTNWSNGPKKENTIRIWARTKDSTAPFFKAKWPEVNREKEKFIREKKPLASRPFLCTEFSFKAFRESRRGVRAHH